MIIKVAEKIGFWADKLRDISALGLTFCRNPYDLENYRKIQDIAVEMSALATEQQPEDFEPIRKTIISRPTPFLAADAAIMNEYDELLLVHRTDNLKWVMPGGYLSVGETAAEGAAREALEEARIQVEPVRIIGVYDSRRSNTASQFHLYTIVFLCKPIWSRDVDLSLLNQAEVLNVKWFSESRLTVADIDPSHVLRISHVFQAIKATCEPYFDR
jgi:8-oxo-dGTP pyrophosphatase MutT (NUDIX family)